MILKYCLYLEWRTAKAILSTSAKILRPCDCSLQDLGADFLGHPPPRVPIYALILYDWLREKMMWQISGHDEKGFYRETLTLTGELSFDVFPIELVDNSAKNETIDLSRKKRFPTFTARSVGGTLTGAVEIGEGGCLYVDDLVEDLEESLNPERLQSKYDAYLNQLKDRKKEGAIELMVGTRWNVFPLGWVGTIQITRDIICCYSR